MAERTYLHLLILCGILCHGIIASNDDTRESTKFLERKRRVINHYPGAQSSIAMEQASYIVNIKRYNRAICVGAILSHYTVITASVCFAERDYLAHYTIFAGATYDEGSKVHVVTSKSEYFGNTPHEITDGIALVTVDPPFVYNRTTRYIQLHTGPLPTGTLVTVRGWGCVYPPRPGPQGIRRRLRSITLPIMDHRECQNEYRHQFSVTEKYVCTYDERQYCARTDAGTPLIANGMLAGIHVWKGEIANRRNPDVFVDVNRFEYRAWIMQNTLLM